MSQVTYPRGTQLCVTFHDAKPTNFALRPNLCNDEQQAKTMRKLCVIIGIDPVRLVALWRSVMKSESWQYITVGLSRSATKSFFRACFSAMRKTFSSFYKTFHVHFRLILTNDDSHLWNEPNRRLGERREERCSRDYCVRQQSSTPSTGRPKPKTKMSKKTFYI